MKKIAIIILVLALAIPAIAQEESLLGSENSHGGFGGPVVKFSQLDGRFATLAGGRGGWIINHSLMLGAAGYGLVEDNIGRRNITPSGSQYLKMEYAGIMMEYDCHPQQLTHTSIIMLIGGGHIDHGYKGANYDRISNEPQDDFLVYEPEFNFTLNMTSGIRLSAGASYRFVSGIEMDGLTNSDLSGPAVSATLRFGKF
jgi:hypothetical protein